MMYRPDSRLFKGVLALSAIVCLAASPALAAFIDLTPQGNAVTSADDVSLAALQADPTGGIVVGDKIFSGFSYAATGDMPDATNVNVLGFRDPDGNWGVRFQGSFLDLPGGGFSDAAVSFIVEVSPDALAKGLRISDAHLFLHGSGVGEDSFFAVDESFTGLNDTLNAHNSTLGPATTQNPDVQLSDSVFFTGLQTKLVVTKDILAIAADGSTQPARGTVVDQSFSQQVIPEPATLVLAGISCLAMVAIGRRRG